MFHTPRQTKHWPMEALVINIITQDLISRKITRQKIKTNIIGRKRGPAKTIFGQKSGPAMAGPAVPPTTALVVGTCIYQIRLKEAISIIVNYNY